MKKTLELTQAELTELKRLVEMGLDAYSFLNSTQTADKLLEKIRKLLGD